MQESNTTSSTLPTGLLGCPTHRTSRGLCREILSSKLLVCLQAARKIITLTFLCFLALQDMPESHLLRAQGLLGNTFQRSFIFTITGVPASHLPLSAKQIPNGFGSSRSSGEETRNTDYREGRKARAVLHPTSQLHGRQPGPRQGEKQHCTDSTFSSLSD